MPRNYQIYNRGDNYYDTMLADLLFGERYPFGTTERKKVGGEWTDVPRAPEFPPGTEAEKDARRRAKRGASAKEDEALRGALGSSRAAREGEPTGMYALANYPGLMSAVDWASTGNTPGGSGGIGQWMAEQRDPELARRGQQKRMDWARRQRELLGLGGSAQDYFRRRR